VVVVAEVGEVVGDELVVEEEEGEDDDDCVVGVDDEEGTSFSFLTDEEGVGDGDSCSGGGSSVALIEALAGDPETLLVISLVFCDENGNKPGLQGGGVLKGEKKKKKIKQAVLPLPLIDWKI
jgi:hypothetical protein